MSRLDGTPWMSAAVRRERSRFGVRFGAEGAAATGRCLVAVPFATGLAAAVRDWLGFDGVATALAGRVPAAAVLLAPAFLAVVRVPAVAGRVAGRALPPAAVFFFAAAFFAAAFPGVLLFAARFFSAGFFAAAAFLLFFFAAAFFFAPCLRVAGRAAGLAALRAAFFTDVVADLAAGRAAFFLAMAVPFGSLTVGAN